MTRDLTFVSKQSQLFNTPFEERHQTSNSHFIPDFEGMLTKMPVDYLKITLTKVRVVNSISAKLHPQTIFLFVKSCFLFLPQWTVWWTPTCWEQWSLRVCLNYFWFLTAVKKEEKLLVKWRKIPLALQINVLTLQVGPCIWKCVPENLSANTEVCQHGTVFRTGPNQILKDTM